MEFTRARAFGDVRALPSAASTFDAVDASAPDWTSWATLDQRSGRGRIDRRWQTPPGEALAVCTIMRPTGGLTWAPLAVGLALVRVVTELIEGDASLKWPNDVLIDGRKVSGILCELRGSAVVAGFGVNLVQEPESLLPTATSLRQAGAAGSAEELADAVLAGMLEQLRSIAPRLGSDVMAAEVEAACSTIGQRVRAELPGGDGIVGEAIGLDPAGGLVIRMPHEDRTVTSADIVHLRRA